MAATQTHLLTGSLNDFGRRADGIVTLHTFENSDPNKNTLRDAIAGARWQQNVPGSYNRIIAVDGILQTIPDDHASGGINPSSASFAPAAWLSDFLSPEEIRNPNYFTLNLCAMGRRAWYDANGWPAGIIDGFARSIIDEEARIGRGVVVTNHADFQSNRSDAGSTAISLVMARYRVLKSNVKEIDDVYGWIPSMKHQLPKPVVVRKGAVPLANPDGTEHSKGYQFPTDTLLECVGGVHSGSQFWVCRREGGNGLFLIRSADVASWPKVPVAPTVDLDQEINKAISNVRTRAFAALEEAFDGS